MNHLPGHSRVWVYKSDRPFNDSDKALIRERMNSFIPKWAAHGNQLFGDWSIERDWFLIIALDESKSMASGCSIDSSVQAVKAIGNDLKINFFDRLNVLIEKNEELKEIHFSEISNHKDAKLFNPMVEQLADLQNNWLIPVSESQFV